jgi:hypothetical protein
MTIFSWATTNNDSWRWSNSQSKPTPVKAGSKGRVQATPVIAPAGPPPHSGKTHTASGRNTTITSSPVLHVAAGEHTDDAIGEWNSNGDRRSRPTLTATQLQQGDRRRKSTRPQPSCGQHARLSPRYEHAQTRDYVPRPRRTELRDPDFSRDRRSGSCTARLRRAVVGDGTIA